MDWWINAALAITGYLLGMAFAGSFLGRKWMGIMDIFLHKIFEREVTTSKYLYWKHFCGIKNPPRPASLREPSNLKERILSMFV